MARKIDDHLLLKMLNEGGKNQKECAAHFGVSEPAICKRLKRLRRSAEKVLEKYDLTASQKKFVIEKANGETNTQAARVSFECNSLDSAKSIGSALMQRPEVEMAIDELMAEAGLTKRYRLKRLKNHIDHADPIVSLKGLDLSYKLDGSYAPEKHLIGTCSLTEIIEALNPIKKAESEAEQEEGLENASSPNSVPSMEEIRA